LPSRLSRPLAAALAALAALSAVAEAGTAPPPVARPALLLAQAPAPDGAPVPGEAAPPAAALPENTGADAAKRPPAPLTRGLAGAYLAARQAVLGNDFVAASDYFLKALAQDPHEAFLIDSALVSLVSSGRMDEASALADRLAARKDATELAGVIRRAAAAKAEDWPRLLALLDEVPDRGGAIGSELLEGMLRAWALLGSGQATEAMAEFERLARLRGAKAMIDYNLALLHASVGDYEGAEALLAQPGTGDHLLGIIARAEVLAQLDRRDEALALIEAQPAASEEPALLDLTARLVSGQPVPFTGLAGARDGVAQTFLTFATALAVGEEPDPLALVQARLATWLNPDLAEARLVTAQLLQVAGEFDLAEEEYEAMRRLGSVRPVAELARIDALARADRLEDAQKAATALTEAHPELSAAWITRGDILRQREDYAAAIPAYSRALDLIEAGDGEARWFPLYARGIARERSGDFDGAEADMRAALEIRPDQAQILNYLGYSFIDRNMKLDEGLAMVEKAARLRPEDGYIQDSLGWGYYRVGRFQEAVAPMERAATQMSNDPLVNDHLGDVYWMAGRQREAETQWKRALSLALDDTVQDTDNEVDPDRIRAKLERGLDAVLADERAGRPLMPAARSPVGGAGPANGAAAAENGSGRVD